MDALEELADDARRRAPDEVLVDDVGVGLKGDPASLQARARLALTQRVQRQLEHAVTGLRVLREDPAFAGIVLTEVNPTHDPGGAELDREGVVGESIRQFYTDAGRLCAYDEQRGLPIVLALAWRKLPRAER